ncbi:LysR family transcriptional regulator [Rhizobium sp. NFACC06-2]|uniref:LysR family transcriptional regulator n=1 Tax=Rhizobium sp. NFACC06-2 TaxID=1566264 RepID=UPI00087726CB|nr:LysR family transcriptional regulator [Rhizobium sp. NFACC06-2]SCY74454.1 DNA-binding transcriptional regulator, LysR family [Rhizobium sp. NFACC06-2]
MDLRQLQQFLAVADELHFGRAATRLNMSQPPLSQAIQALERELGAKLFERTKRTVKLSSVGRLWLPHARRAVEHVTSLPALAARLARGEIGHLRIAFVSTADYNQLPALISGYRTAYPNVELSLREATSDVQIEAILRDEIDIGVVIGPTDAALHPRLQYVTLLREKLVAAVPDQWILEGRDGFGKETVCPEEIFAAPLILFPRRSAPAFHDLISGYFNRHGANFSVHQEAIQMQTIIGLVAAGLGIALVPESMRSLERKGARYLVLEGEVPEVETGFLWRNDNTNPAQQNFVRMVTNTIYHGLDAHRFG